jgi:non-lysosomal glucosylceramidase
MTESRPLFDIPRQAWSHPLGVGCPDVGQPLDRNDAPIDDGPWAGVPLGGLGAGSIGRTQRGDFARWHLRIGRHVFRPVPACQFSLFVGDAGGHSQAHVLSTLRPDTGPTAWNWDMPEGAGTYRALFPRAWSVLDWPALGVEVAGSQMSPILPGNSKESSYPVGVFEWRLRNPTDQPLSVSVMFSWQALAEDASPARGVTAHSWAEEESTGVVLANAGDIGGDTAGEFAIAVAHSEGATVSVRRRFAIDDGADLWADFAADGLLSRADDGPAHDSPTGAAVAIRFDLPPGGEASARFALAWDFPVMRFGSGTGWYRRYTRFFGRSGTNAQAIARDGLRRHREWEAAIEAWQAPMLNDPARPDWYTMALLNELYVLVDGATAWEDGQVGGVQPADGQGEFAILECPDYPYYNTYDVLFYASWALALLWPELERRVMTTLVSYVPLADDRGLAIRTLGSEVTRKLAGAVPHDAGGPNEDPWLQPNAYDYRDPNGWKDLNPKFVLQLWRDRVLLDDVEMVRAAWPAVKQSLDYMRKFDRDGDGLPEHDGIADQTFDNWTMTGPSAYGGGLWLAALTAAERMAHEVGDLETAGNLGATLDRGRRAYSDRLWTGQYLRFDAAGPSSVSVMADQLCGIWYSDATGLAPYVDDVKVDGALDEIMRSNVTGFEGGSMGAVNGALPGGGGADTSSLHSLEVWPGVTYALAALLHHRGRTDDAWAVAQGAVRVTYERGLWFRTPEAWDANGDFRAAIYLRPLSIWAIEHALRQREPKGTTPD